MTSNNKTILNLNFQNTAVNTLPVDPITENYIRTVPNACLSLVDPTPVTNPQLIHYSREALSLLDIDINEVHKPYFPLYFSGNQNLPGSQPYASAYCGHQFKIYVNLGDGRALTLGEVVNNKGERWEVQLKGSGKTPFSRHADGRAALRSSIREFLCSEAMYHLGIPTTRAATLITSDTEIDRDIEYNGNVIQEKATIISRLAPTFIRFGSFQIADPMGPSFENKTIIHDLLNYVIYTHYPHIYNQHSSIENKTIAFAKEVCLKTAQMVALWQAVGFTHGVLNTDNMSILGLTIDFGPFGFMDAFDPDFVPNTSDKEGRYRYSNQSSICKWNLERLFQSIGLAVPGISAALKQISDNFCTQYRNYYLTKMRLKLGLFKTLPEDEQLIETLLDTMFKTQGDYTNIMRCLSKFQLQINGEKPVLECILKQTNEQLTTTNRQLWMTWLQSYASRIDKELVGVTDITKFYNLRVYTMNHNNPKYILRNYLAQKAIEKAEKGDFFEVTRLFDLLKDPYDDLEKYQNMGYDKKAPNTTKISLSCSS